MKFSTAVLVASAAAMVAATPLRIVKRAPPAGVNDTVILQYALTLEHLENAFYSGALAKFDANAFTGAGLPSWVRGRFQQISDHEATHVTALTTALGAGATKPCNYSFPYTDPKSFAALSSVLENVGVSAYLGAAQYIQDKTYLTVAGSILTTEARHAAWVAAAVNKGSAWSSAFDTPLGLSQVYSLAAGFITGCPSTNPALPVKAFPVLTSSNPTGLPGQNVSYTFNSTVGGSGDKYAVYYNGLTPVSVKLGAGNSATLPKGLVGTFYTVITTSKNTTVTDANTVAGPLISVLDVPSSAA